LHLCAHLTAKDLTQPIFVCADLAKSQDFPHFHPLSSGTVVLGWGCETSSLQSNCFVIDNIQTQLTQLIRHIALFHAIKEDRTKHTVNSFVFCSIFFITFTFCAILDKNCSRKLHAKIEKVAI